MNRVKNLIIGIIIGIILSLPFAFMIAGHFQNSQNAGTTESSDIYGDLEKEGKGDRAYYFLGKRLYQEGHKQKGLIYLNKAIALNPNETLYLEERIDINKYLNRKDETIADLERLLELDPGNLNALSNIVALYSDKYNNIKAIETATKGIENLPELKKGQSSDGRERIYFARAGAYFNLHENEKAFQDLDKAIELDSGSVELLGDIATFNERLERTEEAKKVSRIILSKFPHPETTIDYQCYGVAYRILGEYEKSLKMFTKSSELNPHNHTVIYERAMTHLKNNNIEAARRNLIKIVQLDTPDKKEAEEILTELNNY